MHTRISAAECCDLFIIGLKSSKNEVAAGGESLTIMTKHCTVKIIMDNYDVCVAQTLVGLSSIKCGFGMCRSNGTA